MDLLQHRGPGREAKPGPAILFRDQYGEEAGLGQRGHELGRIFALAIERAPVLAGKPRAQLAHRLADFGEGLVGIVTHGTAPGGV